MQENSNNPYKFLWDEMTVYLIDLNQITKDFGSRGESSALSERILKHILSDELKIAYRNTKIRRDSYGKPFLVGGKRHFNPSSEPYSRKSENLSLFGTTS